MLLSTFLVVLFQSVLVLDALVLAVSTSAYFLDVVLLLLSVLAAVVSVVGCVPTLLLFFALSCFCSSFFFYSLLSCGMVCIVS